MRSTGMMWSYIFCKIAFRDLHPCLSNEGYLEFVNSGRGYAIKRDKCSKLLLSAIALEGVGKHHCTYDTLSAPFDLIIQCSCLPGR